MGYSRFQFGILWRIILLLSLWTGLCYSVISAGWIFLSILFAILSFVALAELLHYNLRVHRDMGQCLQSILAHDFSIHFSDQLNSHRDEVREAANAIVSRFKELQNDHERLLQLTNLVMEHLPVAVICYPEGKACCIFNEAAKRTLGLQIAPSREQLISLHPGLFLQEESNTQKRIVKLQRGSEINQYAVRSTTFKLSGLAYFLITMENISAELEQMETTSWRDLMRVLNHEIVNSITPIVSLSASLAEDLADTHSSISAEERLDAARAISTRSEGLLKFAQGYRLFTKMQEPKKELLQVTSQLESVKQLFAAEKGVAISLITEKSDCIISCDSGHLGQVLVNVLRNAVESYETDEIARITLGYTVGQSDCEIYIEDQGRGMDDEVLSKVFIPYFTTRENGQGLGLSLCKQLVQLNGGKLMIRSRPHKGTKVVIVFPIANNLVS